MLIIIGRNIVKYIDFEGCTDCTLEAAEVFALKLLACIEKAKHDGQTQAVYVVRLFPEVEQAHPTETRVGFVKVSADSEGTVSKDVRFERYLTMGYHDLYTRPYILEDSEDDS